MQLSHTIQLFETDHRLVENFFDAIISLDQNLCITTWNQGASLTFGYTREEVLGKNFENVISPNQFDIKITTIISGLVDNLEWRGEIIHRKKDNSLIFCVASISKVTTASGAFQYVMISRDVSERKELENLQRLNDILEKQLNSKQIELTDFFERINDGFFSVNKEWIFTHINSKAAMMLGCRPSEINGKHLWSEFPSMKTSVFSKAYVKAMETQQYLHFEEYNDSLDKWFQVDIYPSDEGLSVFLKDISEEKNAERKIKESEELYRKIVETAQEGIWMVDAETKTIFVNGSLAKMLGYERSELIGKPLFDFIPAEAATYLGEFQKKGRSFNGAFDVSLLTKDGRLKWVMLNASPIFKNDEYAGILVMVMDITERKNSEQELRDSHQLLRELASRLQHIREEERSSLAREIHDELGQQLTALKLDLYWLSKNLPPNDEKLRARTEGIMKLVNETLPKVEKKAIELHPSLLHDLGLFAAIEWQNKQFLSRNNATINFSFEGSDECLSKDTAIALYRIYQEALTNITRHANATVITTTFVKKDNVIRLTISDNGQGFDKSQMDKKKSLGLLSMKERCIMIGGTCEIASTPNTGTMVSVTVPMEKLTGTIV